MVIEYGYGKERLDAGVQIRFHCAWYAMSENPLEVWRALVLCNEFDIAVPAWASEYLARVASGIAALEPSPARFALELAEAMEFSGDAPKQHAKLMKQRKVVRWLLDQATADEMADRSAMRRHFENAADEFDLSDETIANWWRDFRLHFIFE